jgi:hypothetical protein
MEKLDKILDKDTFKRFKLIEHLINKYPIKQINLNKINKIKDSYIENIALYKIINKTLVFDQSQFIDSVLYNEFSKFDKYIYINEPELDIKISYNGSMKISDKLINIIYSTVKLFKRLYGNRNIKLYIALCSHKRSLTTKIIGSVNVNGGQTDLIKIDVFRREEIIKVLCHELCHFYELDCHSIDKKKDKILENFNVSGPNFLSINEAYTEYLAIMHHIAIISYYTNRSPILFYHYEKIWSLYQVCKILDHYKLKKFEDLDSKEFKQNTNVFSYYIIKFFMLYKLDNKCDYKNLINILNDKEIITIINENIYSNHQNFDDNLRMTLFELNYEP